MQIVTETVTYYVAQDGKKFGDKEACLYHEKSARLREMIRLKSTLCYGEVDEAAEFILGNYEKIEELINEYN